VDDNFIFAPARSLHDSVPISICFRRKVFIDRHFNFGSRALYALLYRVVKRRLTFWNLTAASHERMAMQIATVKVSPRMLLQRTIVVRVYKMLKEIDR